MLLALLIWWILECRILVGWEDTTSDNIRQWVIEDSQRRLNKIAGKLIT